jgi:hypothetical protein
LLIVAYSEYYASSEYVGADEVLMLFKGRIILKLHTQGTHSLGIKLYESCDICGCTYDMDICMVFIVQAYQTSQYVVPCGGIFLGKWYNCFAGNSGGKMNVHSACALNNRYLGKDNTCVTTDNNSNI